MKKTIEKRNQIQKSLEKNKEVMKRKFILANKMVKTASKKSKNYDYEKIIKDIYEYEGKKPYNFIPLKKRRDYGEDGRDFLEQQALDLKEEGKLPKEIEKQLKQRF